MAYANNPYFDEFYRLFPGGPSLDRVDEIGRGQFMQTREDLCRKYSWSIPNEEAIRCISEFSPLVEIGAGTGYWAYLLKAHGAVIEAFDAFPRKKSNSWITVKIGSHEVLKGFLEHSLLLSWPPLNDPMAVQCLRNFRGRFLIYIGEEEGGSTADDGFFKALHRQFNLKRKIDIPSWPHIHDAVWIYERNSKS